jgi:hypothetical protein
MTNPQFCGAYSFLPVGKFNEDPVMWHWLGAPCSPMFDGVSQKPNLFFAGEAYDFKYSGCITGAFNNGRDVAINVINQFNEEAVANGTLPF